MNTRIPLVAALALSLASILPAALVAAPAKVGETAKGKVLTTDSGMTLYTFDKDKADMSACNGPCATAWPPLLAAADAKPEGEWTLVKRADGKEQWTYKGHPLYTWQGDTKAGDISGDGVKGVWHLARP